MGTPMQTVDQVLEARWVIPVEPHGVVLDDHAVAIAGDAVVEVLPIEQARGKYTNAKRIDLSEHALIPGLGQRAHAQSDDADARLG